MRYCQYITLVYILKTMFFSILEVLIVADMLLVVNLLYALKIESQTLELIVASVPRLFA